MKHNSLRRYEGNQIESGKKSVAFSLKLRSKDKTLTDDDADSAMKKRLRLLKSSAQLSEAEKTADKIKQPYSRLRYE